MNNLLAFISDPANDFAGQTITYLQLCGLSILLAILIGVVLGIAVSRSAVLGFIAVNISGLMRAIPVIAFLIAALPVLGLGFQPALIALTVLGIPPILLNTYTGVRGIDPAIIDAARGMGMTRWQIITRIQTPLILPVVAAGIRTSAVQVVATATLGAFIGAGGYGAYIVDGLYSNSQTKILAGALPVMILAMLIEGIMGWLQFTLTPAGLRSTPARTRQGEFFSSFITRRPRR
ncbi:MAG: ABC transporter permease [Ktedonobacteraceae bacterium]|nr:ABC transporter permease [Ktedonobacteraceae bacterium]MBO0792275.1 ABC transporter permease [Ktedonobacteraceae bacterium]